MVMSLPLTMQEPAKQVIDYNPRVKPGKIFTLYFPAVRKRCRCISVNDIEIRCHFFSCKVYQVVCTAIAT